MDRAANCEKTPEENKMNYSMPAELVDGVDSINSSGDFSVAVAASSNFLWLLERSDRLRAMFGLKFQDTLVL